MLTIEIFHEYLFEKSYNLRHFCIVNAFLF